MKITVQNISGWTAAFQRVAEKLKAEKFATKIAELMRQFVHVRTGKLKRSISSQGNTATASAPYAEVEAGRGGSHDFAGRAIGALSVENIVVEAINVFH